MVATAPLMKLTEVATMNDSQHKVIAEVLAERKRQIEVEEWDIAHDDEHESGTLAKAAATYTWSAIGELSPAFTGPRMDADIAVRKFGWPWNAAWWKPKGPRRDLIRAAALIVAEIERIDRRAPTPEPRDRLKASEQRHLELPTRLTRWHARHGDSQAAASRRDPADKRTAAKDGLRLYQQADG